MKGWSTFLCIVLGTLMLSSQNVAKSSLDDPKPLVAHTDSLEFTSLTNGAIHSPFVVLGTVLDQSATSNLARDPNNPSQPDQEITIL